MVEDGVTMKLYQTFPMATLTRYLTPAVIIWFLALWGAVVVAQPDVMWFLRGVFVVDGLVVAFFANALGTFFTKRFRTPLLTLDKDRLKIRDLSLPWEDISQIAPLDKFGLRLVGIYPQNLQAFLEGLTSLQRTYYGRQLRAYGGALPVPLVREMSREQLLKLLNDYRLAPAAGQNGSSEGLV